MEIVINNIDKVVFSYNYLDINSEKKQLSLNDYLSNVAIYIDDFDYNYLLNGEIKELNLIIGYINNNNKKEMLEIKLSTRK